MGVLKSAFSKVGKQPFHDLEQGGEEDEYESQDYVSRLRGRDIVNESDNFF